MYQFLLEKRASKEFKKLPKDIKPRIGNALRELMDNPRPPQSKKMVGVPLYRLRVGDYRVLYHIDDEQKELRILSIGHRKDIYRR